MRIADIFSGAGGLSLGFQAAGLPITVAVDNWKPALDTYRLNFAHELVDLDLADSAAAVDLLTSRNIDCIIGGSPCQDFSTAGQWKGIEGERGRLTRSFLKIIQGVRPNIFVLENVRGLLSHACAREIVALPDYHVTPFILDASLYRVPQRRVRVFFLGALGRSVKRIAADVIARSTSPKRMTMRAYFGNELGLEHYYHQQRGGHLYRSVFGLDEPHLCLRSCNPPLSERKKPHPADATHDLAGVRALTPLERARVQTFPKCYKWPDDLSKSHLEQLIANAVPPNLAWVVANAIKRLSASCT